MSIRPARRHVLQFAFGATIDHLESRRFLDATAWNLSSGSLIQNWENAALIATSNDWSLVPSIEGYTQNTVSGTNNDPQLLLSDTGSTLNVLANQTSAGISTGGVIEVQLATPVGSSGGNTVGMQGSAGAHEPYLKIYLNNSGRSSAVRIAYDLIDIDGGGGSGAPQQSFALQYRISASGAWTNVPAGYVQNAADFTTGATGLTNSKDITLPANTINAARVEVRIITTDSFGADQLVAVDNLRVFGSDVFAFQPATYSVIEDAGTIQLTVKRLGSLSGTATVGYALSAGSASVPGDVLAASGTLTFANGVDTQTIPVTIVNDTSAEPAESFTVALSNPSTGFSLGANATATVSIIDNDRPLPEVVLNELKIDPPDADGSAEYVELRGNDNLSLVNVYFVSIEGDGTGSGTADLVVDLSAASLGSAGYLLMGAPGITGPAGTTIVTDADFALADGILEIGSNTFALIYSLTPIIEAADLDANGDGSLELPAGAVVLDAIAASDGGTTDDTYGPLLTPPAGTFHAATRFAGDLTQQSSEAWYSGNLVDPSLGDASETGVYDPRVGGSSTNLPIGAVLTPGAANFSAGVGPGAFVLIPISQTVDESAGTLTFTVYRAGGASGAASVTVGANGGSATSGADYAPFTQTLSFANGEFLKNFSVTINNDSLAEVAETISIQLSTPTGATILREGTGLVTINLSDAVAPTGLLLNELDINPPGADQPYEYIELRGQAGTQLVNVYILSVEGSGTAAGTIDHVIDLTGAVLGSNGLLMIKSPTGGFAPEDTLTGVFTTTLFDGVGFENDSNSILLVFIPIGTPPPATGVDLDVDNTGVLPLDPAIVRLDAIAVLDPDVGDVGYGGAVLGPVNTVSADAADAMVRFPNDADAFDASAWYYGNLLSTNAVQSQKMFSPTQISGNFPAGGLLTPGAANFPSTGDTVAPTVVSSVFNFLTPSGVQQNLAVTFSEDVGASLLASDFQLVNLDTGAIVSLTLAGVSGDGKVATLTFSGTGNSLGASILQDGHYRIRVLAGQVADPAGNTLAANSDTPFAFKNADFDGDLDVDFDNLLTLAQNYGGSGKTFALGDANYDGVVDFDDLLALAQRYGTNLFSATPITRKSSGKLSSGVLA